MPVLQVRDIPQDLYDRLKKSAEAERRSMAQHTIILLDQALSLAEQKEALARMIAHAPIMDLDPESVIRSMRDERG